MKKWIIVSVLACVVLISAGNASGINLDINYSNGWVYGRAIEAVGNITIRVWEQRSGSLVYVGAEEDGEFSFPVGIGVHLIRVVDSSGALAEVAFSITGVSGVNLEVENGANEIEEIQKPVETSEEWLPERKVQLDFAVGTNEFVLNDSEKGRNVHIMYVPTIYNHRKDRVLVPVRFLAEALEFKVSFDEKTGGVTITNGEDTIHLQIGSSVLIKNGEVVNMDTAVIEQNWRTYLPLRYVGQAFEFNVTWNGLEEKATLKKTFPAEKVTTAILGAV